MCACCRHTRGRCESILFESTPACHTTRRHTTNTQRKKTEKGEVLSDCVDVDEREAQEIGIVAGNWNCQEIVRILKGLSRLPGFVVDLNVVERSKQDGGHFVAGVSHRCLQDWNRPL